MLYTHYDIERAVNDDVVNCRHADSYLKGDIGRGLNADTSPNASSSMDRHTCISLCTQQNQTEIEKLVLNMQLLASSGYG